MSKVFTPTEVFWDSISRLEMLVSTPMEEDLSPVADGISLGPVLIAVPTNCWPKVLQLKRALTLMSVTRSNVLLVEIVLFVVKTFTWVVSPEMKDRKFAYYF